ncbi:hypothetical protein PV381_34345 [Streptomyces scabiei]|uniref:hypothetical protein n=1 Tax=Streptomyces scabiei TaxID=1930 RepID=UPI0029A15A83|nr:hypothetical protein [Streptomyces scabiei]MDX2631583.1 hypothetical protein [Streptomyces scabiei]
MGEKKRKPSDAWSVYGELGLSPVYKNLAETIISRSGITDSILKQQRLNSSLGVLDAVKAKYPLGAVAYSKHLTSTFRLAPTNEWWVRAVLGPDPFGLNKYAAPPSARGWLFSEALAADPFGLSKFAAPASVQLYSGPAKAAGLSTFARGFQSKTSVIDGLFPSLFDHVKAPLAPGLPQQAEKLADLLLPVNLQGFSDAEWERLIGIAAEDGIGLMWAPSTRHLRALLAEPDREGRYAYLLRHLDELLDELSVGLQEVTQEPLKDLVQLGNRAIECARAGLWEGALAVATNVLYSATEKHGLRWYHQEFQGVRDHNNQPIQGMTGPNRTLQFVLRHFPMPERRVGIFELSAHLVIRPMAETFQNSDLVRDQHNRHAVCHEASYSTFRKEYLLPALLNMHALLRGLDEKMADDSEAD